jgi:alpha-beta hydrolase superfamily lysophospholipase
MKDWWQETFPKGRQSFVITDANGYPVKIAYGEKGTGKPLFLLHGVGSWSYNWRHSVQPLSEHFRVICFDAKGYGFSEKPVFRREQSGHQIIELERVILSLCDEPVVLVAESLGALIALGSCRSKSPVNSAACAGKCTYFSPTFTSLGNVVAFPNPLRNCASN